MNVMTKVTHPAVVAVLVIVNVVAIIAVFVADAYFTVVGIIFMISLLILGML